MGIVMKILLLVSSLILIGSILLQSGKTAGLSGSIAGGAEQIWGKNKGRSYEAMLERVTTVSAVIFLVSALVLTAVQ